MHVCTKEVLNTGTPSVLISPAPTVLCGGDVVETNLGAEEMYAEVSEKQRVKTELSVAARPFGYLEVVRDATPKDYSNEELYQSMEKRYYMVSLSLNQNDCVPCTMHARDCNTFSSMYHAFDFSLSLSLSLGCQPKQVPYSL